MGIHADTPVLTSGDVSLWEVILTCWLLFCNYCNEVSQIYEYVLVMSIRIRCIPDRDGFKVISCRRGHLQPGPEGAPTYDFAIIFMKNGMIIEKIFTSTLGGDSER